jgi:hypothetical protein
MTIFVATNNGQLTTNNFQTKLMKKVFATLVIATLAIVSTATFAQKKEDKSKRPSKPAIATQTIASGAKITIDYSQPLLKGRIIGKDVEPMESKIWRAGANEATVFETSKDITVEGSKLPKGKYAFFAIKNEDFWTLIFNKTWKTWGAYDYEKNKANDALIVKVRVATAPQSFEKLTYTISKDGHVSLGWGNELISFKVQ